MTSLNHYLTELSHQASFGFDYILESHGNLTVIDPTSPKALDWLYRELPESTPRFGLSGFVVQTSALNGLVERMRDDGLMSESEYVYSMNANDNDMRAGE